MVFAFFAILAVVALDRTTIGMLDFEHHLSSTETDVPKPVATNTNIETIQRKQNSWIIPTYPVGDLLLSEKKKPVAEKKKPNVIPRKKKNTATRSKRVAARKPSTKRKGEFPVLEVGYDEIGFLDYLDAIERVGHFFLISNSEKGTEIGSEISLKNSTVYRHKIDLSNLAVKRPHLVSDNMIKDRLSGISLPEGVRTDSIILVFTKPFDDLLWDTIANVLLKNKLTIKDVSRIDGGYLKVREDVFLIIHSAENRTTGEVVPLNRRLRISLG